MGCYQTPHRSSLHPVGTAPHRGAVSLERLGHPRLTPLGHARKLVHRHMSGRLWPNFLLGLAVGALLGLCYAVGAALLMWPGLVLVALLVAGGPWSARLGGVLTGFGAMWFVLLAAITWTCARDPSCVQPNETFWVMIGATILVPGVVLGVVAWRHPTAP